MLFSHHHLHKNRLKENQLVTTYWRLMCSSHVACVHVTFTYTPYDGVLDSQIFICTAAITTSTSFLRIKWPTLLFPSTQASTYPVFATGHEAWMNADGDGGRQNALVWMWFKIILSPFLNQDNRAWWKSFLFVAFVVYKATVWPFCNLKSCLVLDQHHILAFFKIIFIFLHLDTSSISID